MSLFVIRSSKRYAVRYPVSLDPADAGAMDGLLIEISLEGCRISNLGSGIFETGQPAVVEIAGFGKLPVTVRWSHDRVMGLRFDKPLHSDGLGRLLAMCRDEAGEMRAYGT